LAPAKRGKGIAISPLEIIPVPRNTKNGNDWYAHCEQSGLTLLTK